MNNPILAMVNTQAEDEGLWFKAETAPEAYLQRALRSLHLVIENNMTIDVEDMKRFLIIEETDCAECSGSGRNQVDYSMGPGCVPCLGSGRTRKEIDLKDALGELLENASLIWR